MKNSRREYICQLLLHMKITEVIIARGNIQAGDSIMRLGLFVNMFRTPYKK